MKIVDFEPNRERFAKQYKEAQWVSGTPAAELLPQLRELYDGFEAKGVPYAVAKAKILSFMLDHCRIAVNDFDLFAVICERNAFFEHLGWERMGNIAVPALGGERARRREQAAQEGAFTVNVDMSHTCPDWDAVLTLGASGLLKRAEEHCARTPTPFYEAVRITFAAFRRFILRFSEASRTAGRADLAGMTDFLADRPPETLQQALELGLLYREMQELEGELVRSMGIFDRQYFPFYEHDLAAGILTKESALELLTIYFSHCGAQASCSANMHYCFGGRLADGRDGCNELTRLAFAAFRRLGVVDPKFSLRVNDDTPEDLLGFAAETVKEGKSAILFINEGVVRKAFLRNGKDPADLHDFVPIGCYEPAIMGKELCCSMTGLINMVKNVEKMMKDPAFEPRSFDEVLARYCGMLRETLNTMMDWIDLMEPHWPEVNPTTAISGTMTECMERGLDGSAAGTKYRSSGIMCAGIGTVTDSLAAVRDLVFEKKRVTFAELRQILARNWEGAEKLRLEAFHRSPKWGNGDPRADELAQMVAACAAETIERHGNSKGGHFQMGLWSINYNLIYGRLTGATPDGRRAGECISKNTCASIGCDREGIAGMIASAVKLDYSHFADGSVLDVMLPARSAAGEAGTAFLLNVFQTFRKQGGAFMHFNILSPAALRAAQKEPEKYANLQIRLCGWNVRFIDLRKDMQECLIREAEWKEA